MPYRPRPFKGCAKGTLDVSTCYSKRGLEELRAGFSKVQRSETYRGEQFPPLHLEGINRAGLPRDLFDESRVLVTTQELFALWRSIEVASDDPLIGLKLGVETKTERFHPMAIAALSTENFKTAQSTWQVIRNSPHRKRSFPNWAMGDFGSVPLAPGGRCRTASACGLLLSWMVTLARHGTGVQLKPVRIEYVHARKHQRALSRYFGCEIVEGAAQNAIIFRADDALAPFVTRNTELLAMLAPQFEEQLRQHKEEDANARPNCVIPEPPFASGLLTLNTECLSE